MAIVIPCKSAAPILECDEYGYTDDGYLCDGGEDYYETEDSNDECNGRETKMHCSASILNEQTFVTAAHCFVELEKKGDSDKILRRYRTADEIMLMIGDHDLGNTGETRLPEVRSREGGNHQINRNTNQLLSQLFQSFKFELDLEWNFSICRNTKQGI